MIGATLDRVSPFTFARAQIGRGQQLSQSHDAGQWRANIVRDAGEGSFDGSRLRAFAYKR
jgi:hypothetical protein